MTTLTATGPASHLHRCAQEDLFHGLGSLPKPARRGSKGTIVPMPSLSGPKKSYCSVEQLLGGPLHHARTVRLSNPTMRASCLPQNGQGSVLGVFQPLHALVQAALPNLRHMPLACLGFPGAGPPRAFLTRGRCPHPKLPEDLNPSARGTTRSTQKASVFVLSALHGILV